MTATRKRVPQEWVSPPQSKGYWLLRERPYALILLLWSLSWPISFPILPGLVLSPPPDQPNLSPRLDTSPLWSLAWILLRMCIPPLASNRILMDLCLAEEFPLYCFTSPLTIPADDQKQILPHNWAFLQVWGVRSQGWRMGLFPGVPDAVASDLNKLSQFCSLIFYSDLATYASSPRLWYFSFNFFTESDGQQCYEWLLSGYIFYLFPFVTFICIIICWTIVSLTILHDNGARSVSVSLISQDPFLWHVNFVPSFKVFTFSLTCSDLLSKAQIQCKFLPYPPPHWIYTVCVEIIKKARGERRKKRRNLKSIFSLPRLY